MQTVTVGPRPSVATTPPAAPRTPVQAATQPARRGSPELPALLTALAGQQPAAQAGRVALKAAKTPSARRAAQAKIKRLGKARMGISASRAKCLRG